MTAEEAMKIIPQVIVNDSMTPDEKIAHGNIARNVDQATQKQPKIQVQQVMNEAYITGAQYKNIAKEKDCKDILYEIQKVKEEQEKQTKLFTIIIILQIIIIALSYTH